MTVLARLLGRILAADVREHPDAAVPTGVAPGGSARTVVGRLHPRALGDSCEPVSRLRRPA